MRRGTQPFEFAEPTEVADALALATLPGSRLFAGGCELAHAMRRGDLDCARLVSIMHLPGLDDFRAHPRTGLEFGAQVLLRRLAADIWVSKRWAALHEAIEQIQPPHIVNMGTVVGNVCAASIYHDLATALAAHRAMIRIDNGSAVKDISIDAFYVAPGETVLRPGEMVSSIFAPPPAADAGSAFRKISRAVRGEGDIGKVSASAYVALDTAKETVTEAVLVIGSLGSMPRRMYAAEAFLCGVSAETDNYAAAADRVVESLARCDDIAALDDVMVAWIRVLARDVLEQAASRARSRHDPSEDAHLAY
ncbi:FAD binding domain-containing protein [Rhizobium leguminosarum]|uniref:FAD binding domain-containing protein n=1 Tax=Rhizobium leguminosarum TaxID=384 RepID=UPI0024A9C7F4|nr:FAD binding domain-containing protein [Rhizobium leguminosarum]MDI5929162.1 FAD binding domain-containing protein [Rhizobium leguminosarum]